MDNTDYGFNVLLRHRTFEFLCEMNFEQRVSLLEDIFSESPSKESWDSVYEFFDSIQDDKEELAFAQLAEKQLSSWEDHLKIVHSSSKYIRSEKKTSSFVKLIKGVIIYRRETNGNDHLLHIAKNKNLEHITYLRIYDSELMESGLRALISSKVLQNLEVIRLEKISLTLEMKKIMLSGFFPKLKKLILQKVGFSDEDKELINAASLLKNVEDLDLSFNILSDGFVESFISSFQNTSLRRLIIRGNFIRQRSAGFLSANVKFPELSYLDISGNKIEEKDKQELVQLATGLNMQLIL